MKYIDTDSLIAYLEKEADIEFKKTEENANSPVLCHFHNGCRMQALDTIDFIKQLQQEQPEVDLEDKVTFDCISKKVTMTVRELINYYIDRECCDVAEECGF